MGLRAQNLLMILFLIQGSCMNSSFSEVGRPVPMHPHEFSHMMSPYDYLPCMAMGMDPRSNDSFNPRQIKRIVDEMRFKEKMEAINKKKGKYKRSTNNCHKKYIGIVKNLVCLKLNNDVKESMLERFFPYRNSRVYYFIILSYLKWHATPAEIKWVFQHFIMEVSNKIQRYDLQIRLTNNTNFIHFRRDQILEMEFSIDSIYNFLSGNQEEAMRILYQKNKYIIIKKNEYLKTLQIIKELREELCQKFEETDIHQKEQELDIEEIYRWREPSFANMAEYPLPADREWPNDRYLNHSRVDYRLKEEIISQRDQSNEGQDILNYNIPQSHPEKMMVGMVKQEDKGEEIEKKYPLAGLQNSYPVIDYLTWQSWVIQKQKNIEFYIKSRGETTNSMPFYQDLSPVPKTQ